MRIAIALLGMTGSVSSVRAEEGDALAKFSTLGHLPDRPGETLLPGAYASYIAGMSASGEVVVGTTHFNNESTKAFRWTRADGLVVLSDAPWSRTQGISADGVTIALYGGDGLSILREGTVRKVPSDLALRPAFGGPVLNDGTLFASCRPADRQRPGPVACRLDGTTGELTFLPPSTNILAADQLGNVAGARWGGSLETHYLSVATLNSQVVGWPQGGHCPLVNSCEGAVHAFSTGAEVAVGIARVGRLPSQQPGPQRNVAFVMPARGPMTILEDLAGGEETAGAVAISADGKVIGGHGTDADGKHAVVWLGGVPRKLSELIVEAGGVIPTGFILREVVAVSSDGKVFVGEGEGANRRTEGFHVAFGEVIAD